MAKSKKKGGAKKSGAKKGGAKKSSAASACKTVSVCGQRRKLCWGTKTIHGVRRRVIVSNKPA